MRLEMDEPRVFRLERLVDESGVSGTGRVLDGVVFHTGQVVVCWRSDVSADKTGYSSIAIYPSMEAFSAIHVDPHPPGTARVSFSDD